MYVRSRRALPRSVAVVVLAAAVACTDSGTPPQAEPTRSDSSTTLTSSTTTTTIVASATTSVTRERTPEEAIETHLRSFQLEYAGPCDDVPQGEATGQYCSTLHEDRGTTRIYSTGPVFSEFDAWLLLARDQDGWSVTDAASTGSLDEPQPPPW